MELHKKCANRQGPVRLKDIQTNTAPSGNVTHLTKLHFYCIGSNYSNDFLGINPNIRSFYIYFI